MIEKFGADSLRFGLAYLTTETQDVRMPVEFECPQCQQLDGPDAEEPRAAARRAPLRQEFSTQWAKSRSRRGTAARRRDQRAVRAGPQLLQQALERPPVRALNLDGYSPAGAAEELAVEDRWLLAGWRR